jgi:hypothetical protein
MDAVSPAPALGPAIRKPAHYTQRRGSRKIGSAIPCAPEAVPAGPGHQAIGRAPRAMESESPGAGTRRVGEHHPARRPRPADSKGHALFGGSGTRRAP